MQPEVKKMAEPQLLEGTEAHPLFEGTIEELLDRKQEFSGMRLQVYAVPEEEELPEDFPDPPTTVRDRAHLEELLREGLTSPKENVTDQEWVQLRQEVRERLAQRK